MRAGPSHQPHYTQSTPAPKRNQRKQTHPNTPITHAHSLQETAEAAKERAKGAYEDARRKAR